MLCKISRVNPSFAPSRAFRLFSTTTSPSSSKQRQSVSVQKEKSEGNVIYEKFDEALLQPPKGTRDFYPEDMRLQNWLFNTWHTAAKLHGFEEYSAPIIENASLYKRKNGEEIEDQLYSFLDKSNRPLALRPEMTPSLARLLLKKYKSMTFPLKWYSIPQCWRYEKMSKGRRREHFQWNLDIIGNESLEAELEIFQVLIFALKKFGLTEKDVVIKFNSRLLLNDLMSLYAVPSNQFIQYLSFLDKLDKMPLPVLIGQVNEAGLDGEKFEKVAHFVINNKSFEDFEEYLLKSLSEEEGKNSSESDREKFDKIKKNLSTLKNFFQLLKLYELDPWIEFDAKVIRGLGYYTGVVFECFDREKKYRAICGGGRYEELLSSLSGNKYRQSAVGVGFGDAVLLEILKDKGLLDKKVPKKDLKIIGYSLDDNENKIILINLFKKLREEYNISCSMFHNGDSNPQGIKLKDVIKKINKEEVPFAVIIGEDEAKAGKILIKDMVNFSQDLVPIESACSYLEEKINREI